MMVMWGRGFFRCQHQAGWDIPATLRQAQALSTLLPYLASVPCDCRRLFECVHAFGSVSVKTWPEGRCLLTTTVCVSRCDSGAGLVPSPSSLSGVGGGWETSYWGEEVMFLPQGNSSAPSAVVLTPGGKAGDAALLLPFPSSCEPGDPRPHP